MKQCKQQALLRQWQSIPAGRLVMKSTLWTLCLGAMVQLLWLPGQERMQQAEQKLLREYQVMAHLKRVSTGPIRSQDSAPALTPAGLTQSAEAAGMRITGLELKAGQVQLSLEGPPAAVLNWLHEQERAGGQVRDLQLQAEGKQLQARLALLLEDA